MTDDTTEGAAPAPENSEPPAAGDASTTDREIAVTPYIVAEVRDALKLLDFGVSSGLKAPEAPTIPPDLIASIKNAAAIVGMENLITAQRNTEDGCDKDFGVDSTKIKVSDWVQFEIAYQKLAKLLPAVTAETLRATETAGKRFGLSSTAQRFTRVIWYITLAFAALTIFTEWWSRRYGPVLDGEVDSYNDILQLLDIFIPFAYGGMGACVYLLRSAHVFIYERTFDVRRKPEYFNRIILGMVGGGAVVLFIDQVTDDEGTVIRISTAALGFLAGYSSDFLFNTIERMITAILPQVGLRSLRQPATRATPVVEVPIGNVTLEDLLERYEKAEAADKDLYRSLIERMRERM